jgi:hypothetical protein
MAATWNVVTQYQGIDTLGGTKTVDVVFVGITTVPHGTYIEFPIDRSVYSPGVVGGAADTYAGIIEAIWREAWVDGVQWTQTVNASNQLQSALIITVRSSSGNSTASFQTTIQNIGPQLDTQQIDALHAELDAVEHL